MRLIWTGATRETFVVWDIQDRMPELAYTTVMTTVARLAAKGLLVAERVPRQRSVHYRAAGTPLDFLRRESEDQAAELVRTFGDDALVAFESQLERLSPDRRRRLKERADR